MLSEAAKRKKKKEEGKKEKEKEEKKKDEEGRRKKNFNLPLPLQYLLANLVLFLQPQDLVFDQIWKKKFVNTFICFMSAETAGCIGIRNHV